MINHGYMPKFDALNINDRFDTDTGRWVVYDKGQITLQAYKLPLDSRKLRDEQLTTFFNYEFSTDFKTCNCNCNSIPQKCVCE